MSKIITLHSLVIDLFEHSYKKNIVLEGIKYLVYNTLKKKTEIYNKIIIIGNIEYNLFKMLDLQSQLKFMLNLNVIRLNGFIYLVYQPVKKFYLKITSDATKSNLD